MADEVTRRRWLVPGTGLLLALSGLLASLPSAVLARADDGAVTESSLPRHPLEEQALNEPEAVLKALPALLSTARDSGNSHDLSLLYLAKANACRVVADWPCQRASGASAAQFARTAKKPILLARALVSESRALIAMQDFSRGERLLGQAELVLKDSPSPELSADVFLAYSSLSNSIGKLELSAEYAARGLDALPRDLALPTRARLYRNLARAQVALGKADAAKQSLAQATALAERIDDPKLSAELLVGASLAARKAGDVAGQIRSGEGVIALAGRLRNSQLAGMGHEILGLAAREQGDQARASKELGAAYESFRSLGLKRDELRVLRELLRVAIGQRESHEVINAMATRFLDIDGEIESSDRAKAADDFDARLKYAERELDVLRLKDEAALASERERALAASNRQSQSLSLFTAAILAVLVVFFLLQRRSNQQLKSTLALLRESEARAHDLLNLSAGFVFMHDLQGRLVLVNPAAAQALGQPAPGLVGRLLQDFQPRSSRELFSSYLERLTANGQDEGVFLVRSGEGDHRHWRYSSRLSAPQDGRAYVVGNAVDVTDQVRHTRELHEQSVRDALTGCYNRRHLEEFETAHPSGGNWAAITVDLVHFKQVNDTQGHDRGDQVLIDFAQFLTERVREDDAVVRLGGDEFLVLLANADMLTLQATAGRLRLDAPLASCEFSLGVALREDGETLAATIARADSAMYATRARERQTVAAASPD